MCGQSLQPLDCSGILHRQKCPPTLISLQGCATASAFMASLCFSSYTRKVAGEKREKKEALCIMQQILARTYSVGLKKKGKEKYKSVASPFFFSRELYFFSVSRLAHDADILVHLIQRSLKSVQRFPLSSVGFAPCSAGAAVLLVNPSAGPALRH